MKIYKIEITTDLGTHWLAYKGGRYCLSHFRYDGKSYKTENEAERDLWNVRYASWGYDSHRIVSIDKKAPVQAEMFPDV